MDPLESLTLVELRRRTSAKWRRYPRDVLPLWVGEMDVAPAPAVVEELRRVADTGDTGYAAGHGYAEAMADVARHRWGWDLPVSRTRVVPDVMRGAVELIGAVTGPGPP